MEASNSARLDTLLKRGELIESMSEMTPDYLKELKHTLIVSGDTELIAAPALYDQDGSILLGDVDEQCSYGPWKRGLVKVMAEENCHLRNGRNWMKRISQAGGAAKDELQQAVDWMFPLTVEWFGLPDNLKQHSAQLDYRLKGLTNDQLRQAWLSTVVPFLDSIGINAPAHQEGNAWVLNYPFPSTFDADDKRWDFND